MLGLFLLLLVSLSFMSSATHNSERFGQLYTWLLLINALGLLVLVTLIGTNLYWLFSQSRRRAPGVRLTRRLVVMFMVLAVVPVSIVYYFSLQFLHRGLDSWFDVRIERALESALELSRSALDTRLREQLRITERLAIELSGQQPALISMGLYDLRVRSGAVELSVTRSDGRIIASSSIDPTAILPIRPVEEMRLPLDTRQPYVSLDPIDDVIYVRAVVPMRIGRPDEEGYVLQALYSIPERLSDLAETVQNEFSRYRELAYLRQPLKYSYTLTLSLVLLLSLLSAVWAAFHSARRLVAPIADLAEGTRAVAEGDYGKRLPVAGEDELGFLVQSFNDMTRRIAKARDQAGRSQRLVEGQRAYLETVLGSLSSGVLSLGAEQRVRTVNEAAAQILGIDLPAYQGRSLQELVQEHEFLQPFFDVVRQHSPLLPEEWQEQVTLMGLSGRRVLMCRGTGLPDGEGHVIVFDDVTALLQAQRDAAWGEVARRLAHEIKNPLTPIQLSAERLRRRYLGTLQGEDAEVLDRATHTIVQQVETMKEMVNAFTEYARAPQMQPQRLELNRLVQEVLDLYRGMATGVTLEFHGEAAGTLVEVDAGRMRQVLHNLIKNALEACAQVAAPWVRITTLRVRQSDAHYIDLMVEDNGPGFPPEVTERLFEPYVTTKPRGTGLGLAIVKKIVEEHGGIIQADNGEAGGARLRIRLQAITTAEGGAGLGQLGS
jgi:nitrogen fixation/metabolism regulation signal transduction histidine kinase